MKPKKKVLPIWTIKKKKKICLDSLVIKVLVYDTSNTGSNPKRKIILMNLKVDHIYYQIEFSG